MSEAAAERRLVAILAADVVGYSRMMEADERDTLARVKDMRQNVIEPKVAEHRGRVFKTNGDGFLVEFTSAVDAVGCAVEIQKQMAARNFDQAPTRRIDLRIGINVGDVFRDGDDLLGDGVNIAARLEGLAAPGGICVSHGVHDPVRERLDFEFVDLGERHVKNIARPIQVFTVRYEGMPVDVPSAAPTPKRFEPSPWPKTGLMAGALVAILGGGLAYWMWPLGHSTPPPNSSVIVVPFKNMTGDVAQDAPADRLADGVIDAFANDSDVDIRPIGESLTYKGKAVEERQVARERNVRYVITGSIIIAGDKLMIKGSVFDAVSGKILASRTIEEHTPVSAETLREVATNLAETFQSQISDVELAEVARQPLNEKDPKSLVAHADDLFEKARGYDDLERAVALSDKASTLAPDYVEALNDSFYYRAELYWLGRYTSSQQRSEVRQTIHRLSGHALELAPELKTVQNLVVLAMLDIGEDDGLEGRIRHLLYGDADSPDLHGYLALALLRQDKIDEARREAEVSIRLGPETSFGPWALGNVELQAGNWKLAIDPLRKDLASNQDDPASWLLLTAALQLAGQTEEAQRSAAQLVARCPGLSISTLRDMSNDPYGTQKPAAGYLATRARIIDALEAAGVP